MRSLISSLAFLLVLPAAAPAQDTDLELVLLADASGSIDAGEIAFQRQGYAEAMTDPAVLAAIADTAYGSIAVTYIEWAQNQAVVVDWTLIATPEDAAGFAEALLIPPRQASGRNAIGSALLAGLAAMEGNDFTGWRRVIDFSGDSINNYHGPPIAQARETVLTAGVTINGLPILNERPYLLEAYEAQIIGGPNSFAVPAETRATFAEAVRRKLILEISGLTPETETRLARAE
ncbi:DUF1194 domain-containing protein [Roseisalinus antarcticus]|uniref:VWFA domain-containing protein n=1 Tax=Roseisalinus antarcticus TaxID=254357 RepID=A0A1Y5SXN5_9RHOB|nr:DUF1194 domain-containing protein [Roseisalinus antarcticus]SLN47518.1 hypothetical protein ROA7023_02004 [Roseisalinus antarcticus]